MQAFQKVPKEKQDTPENEIRVAVSGEVSDYFGYASRILNKSDHKTLTIRATGNAIVKAIILTELVKRRIGDLHQINKIHSLEIVDVYQPKVQGMDPIEQKRRVTAMDTILSKEPLDTEDVGYQQPEPKEERVPQTVDGELEKQATRQKKDKQKRPPRKKTNFNEDPNTKIEPKQKPNKDKKNKQDKDQDKKETKDNEKKDNKKHKKRKTYNDSDDDNKPKERRRGRGGRGRGGTYRDDHDREHHRRERDAIDYPNYDYAPPVRGRRGMRGGPPAERGGRPMRGRGGPAYHDQANALPPPNSYHDDFYVQPRTRGYYPPMGDLYSGRPQRGMRSRGRAMRGNRGGHEDMYHREEPYMHEQYAPRGRGGYGYGDGGYPPMRGGYPRGGRGDMYQGGRGRGGPDYGGFGGGRGRGGPRNYNDDLDGFDRMPPRRGGFNNDDQSRPQRNYQNDDKTTGPNFYEPGQAIPRGRGRGVVRGNVDRRPSGEDMDHERSGDQDFPGRGMRGRRGMRGTFRGDMRGRGMSMSQPFYQTEGGRVENNDQPTRGGMTGARGNRGGTNYND